MDCPSVHLNKSALFFICATFLLGLFWFTGCTTPTKTIIAPREEVVTTPEEAVIPVKEERGITEESLKCISCHEERGVTHGWIADWEGSKHARKGVGCEECHINPALEFATKEAIELQYLSADKTVCEDKRVHRQVIAGNCGRCHTGQYNAFLKSRHSIGWKRMLECEKLMAIPENIRSEKCEQCHNIQFKCDSCHTRHTFNTLEAKTPEACRTCHMGSDHPHYEVYVSSKHGAVYTASQSGILKESQTIKSLRSPVCVTCHMPEGNHDISFGIAYGPVGGGLSYIDKDGVAVDEAGLFKRRHAMLSVCNTCHAPSFSTKTLVTADTIHKNAAQIIQEAKDIISELEKENLVVSPLAKMTDMSFLGHAFVLGTQNLYSENAKIMHLYLRLLNSAFITGKSAYHMNPNYTHLYGWLELQKDLNELREEAKRLREEAELRRKMEIKLR